VSDGSFESGFAITNIGKELVPTVTNKVAVEPEVVAELANTKGEAQLAEDQVNENE